MAKKQIQFEVLGANQFAKLLKDIETRTERNIHKELFAIGELMSGDMKSNVSVDSGRLRGSITYSTDGRTRDYEAVGKANPEDKLDVNREPDSVVIGTNVNYASKIEYMMKPGGQFMVKAYMRYKNVAKELLKRAVQKGL